MGIWSNDEVLGAGDRYFPRHCFATFPFPLTIGALGAGGEAIHERLLATCTLRNVGLTKIANLIDDEEESPSDIRELRDLQIALDQAVLRAYGWDLEVAHVFRDVRGKRRFALDGALATEIVDQPARAEPRTSRGRAGGPGSPERP